jgi:hypothetical protein
MAGQRFRVMILTLGVVGCLLFISVTNSHAVPSFARQTGLDCSSCHTVFPELTSVGRNFKLNGFTASKHASKAYEWPPPVAAMVQLSFTHLNNSRPGNNGLNAGQGLNFDPSNRGNDNVNVPQAISLFYGGRIYGERLGALVQGTYDGVANRFLLDLTDVRLVARPDLFGKPLILGLTFNNNPTVSDVLNTTPSWGFPAALPADDTSLSPGAGPQIEGLASQVGGVGAYFFWNNLLYGEIAVYRTARKGVTQFLGAGSVTDPEIQGVAPYWRVFLQHQWGKHYLAVGHFGLVNRNISGSPKGPTLDAFGNPVPGNPNLLDTQGPIDRFTDIGFDAQYQFIGKKHIFTVQTSYIHEDQKLNDTFSQGGSLNRGEWLDKYKVNANYYYRTDNWGTIGGTVAYVNLWGSGDPVLYGPGAGTGFRTGKPNSDYWIFELDYVPWWKKFVTKFTLQYTVYNRFNGARSKYDGNAGDPANGVPPDTYPFSRRNASFNNTLYLLVWQTF